MTNKLLIKKLNSLNACNEAIEWLGDRDSRQMYDECERGDWLIWLAKNLGVEEKKLHLIGCKIAYSTLGNFEKEFPNDMRPRLAIEAKEKWLRGEITDEELSAAWYAGWSSGWSAARSDAWSSAWSAARENQAIIFREYISYEDIESGMLK